MRCRVNKSPPPGHILSHLSTLHTQHLSGFSGRATTLQALILGCQITMTTTFCTVAPNICVPSVWNLLHVTFLTARILRWFQEFWKVCAPLPYVAFRNMIMLEIRDCDKNSFGIIAEEDEENLHTLH